MESEEVSMDSTSQSNSEDYLLASNILIIHPGSRILRFGRANDPQPQEILHCLARRRKPGKSKLYRDPLQLPKVPISANQIKLVNETRQQICQIFQNSLQSNGAKRYSVPNKHVIDLNNKIVPDALNSTQSWLDPDDDDEVIIGDDVLRLKPNDDSYNVHFPFRRGDINVHDGIGGSQTSILVDLEVIWTEVITQYLNVPSSQLRNYRAVLIIPALYKRPLIKHYLSLLLTNMGFGGAIVLQDHVAATFGAGLGYACVIDIGEQKTSISCVEDGVSHQESRIHLNYGGADISQILFHFLQTTGFPYKKCSPDTNNFDSEIIRFLKEEVCHLDLDQCGMVQKEFKVDIPGQPGEKYAVYFGDEAFIAPCALFHSELFTLTHNMNDKKLVSVMTMGENLGDSEDPHDQIYLNETSRKYTKAGTAIGEGIGTESQDSQNTGEEDLEIVGDVDTNGIAGNLRIGGLDEMKEGMLIPLDQAILKSIESCPNEEMKRKMYTCILLVGGTCQLKGLDKYISQKLALQIPIPYRCEPTEVIMNAKDIKSSWTCWKGASILACLDSAQELWIKPQEWQNSGQKLLREKAPFPWT